MNEDLSLDQYRKGNKCMNNLYDPKVHSITLAQDPKILDGCLNKGLIIGPYECTKDNKQLNETTQLNT
jgi:hypothetical protein